MSKGFLDDNKVKVPCPNCGHKIEKTLGWLTSHKEMTCPSCRETVGLKNAQFKREIAKANKAADEFQRTIKDINKKLKF